MMAGYSGTPLYRKLGLKPGMVAVRLNAPENHDALLGDEAPALDWHGTLRDGADVIHLFTTFRAELEQVLAAALRRMARNGMIWVSWPKKASGLPSEIIEDTVREVALPMGLVDVKVCAVDATWSGLKLVIRKELR